MQIEAMPGNPYRRGRRLGTVDLLAVTSLDHLFLIFPTLFAYFFLQKQAALLRSSRVLSIPLYLVFPGNSVEVAFTLAILIAKHGQ